MNKDSPSHERREKPREAPAVRDAAAFITRCIERGTFRPGAAFPTISRMARMAGVSYVSMWKAVAGLKAAGVLSTRPGQPIRLRSTEQEGREAPADYAPSAKAKWELVKRRIERDILNGVFPPGSLLPSVKQLRNTYGVSHSVLRKAMAALTDEQTIVARARGYASADLPAQQGPRNRVVLIAPFSPKTGQIVGMSSEELVRCLERECIGAHLYLQIIGYYFADDGVRYHDFSTGGPCAIADTDETFGYIAFVPFRESGWEDGLRKLAGVRKPVALIDQSGGLDEARTIMKHNRLFQMFSVCITQKSGRDMGRYLAGLGHRCVVYLSPFHKASWSVNRLAGLVSVFDAAGIPGAVRAVTLDDVNILESQAHSIAQSGIQRILDVYREQRHRLGPHFVASLDRLFHLDDGTLLFAVWNGELSRMYEPLYRRALMDKEATAWVAASDHVAMFALEFLRRRKIAVPGRLTLVGFDDTREALEHKLTTYNFNIPALISAVLRHMLDLRFRVATVRVRTIEVDGMVIRRNTSGPPG